MLTNFYLQARNLSLAILLLPLMITQAFAAAGGIPGAPGGVAGAPNINQCKSKWTMTAGPAMAFGHFAVEPAGGTLIMDANGIVSVGGAGAINLLTTSTTTAFTVTINNTKSALCGLHGINLSWSVPPSPTAGAMALTNVVMNESSIPLTAIALTTTPVTLYPLSLPTTLTFYGQLNPIYPQPSGLYTSPIFTLDLEQSGTIVAASGTATATSVTPINILETMAMDFGTITGGSLGGTVIMDTLGARSISGDAQILAVGPGTAGEFQITGEPSLAYSLIITGPAILKNAGGQQITVNGFTNSSLGTLPASGLEFFQVGATIILAPSQPAGNYSTANGGSAYTVTVNYN